MSAPSESATCVFCKIASGAIPAALVYEDDEFVAFDDIHPTAPCHVLVIPRAHIPTLDACTDEAVFAGLLRVGAEVARRKGIAQGGYRTVLNVNRDGSQEVYHIHLHVLGGRKLGWPPG